MTSEPFCHEPVLAQEAVSALRPRPGGVYVDCTVGGGGHARLLLSQAGPGSRLIGIDRDGTALAAAAQTLAPFGDAVSLVRANFSAIEEILADLGVRAADGILFDLGVSSPQLMHAGRGFSYRHEAPLDMRMDPGLPRTAADLVAEASREELARILREYGEERWADRIAHFVVESRRRYPIRTTGRLVEVIKEAIPASARRTGPHPARRTFQALRIAVNDELGSLKRGLAGAARSLAEEGRLAVISFHSLEDRIVKQTFKELERDCTCPPGLPQCRCGARPLLRVVTRRPLVPSEAERSRNPRARSAKLRVARRVLGAEAAE